VCCFPGTLPPDELHGGWSLGIDAVVIQEQQSFTQIDIGEELLFLATE
jgi:hypothetical protein